MTCFRTTLLSGLFLVALNASAQAVVREETICGWINFEGQYDIALTDAFDTYVLSNDSGAITGVEKVQIRQHGPQWMDQSAREARYCGCADATFNGAELMQISNFKQKQISACLNDPKLPQYGASAAPAPAPAVQPQAAPAPTNTAPPPAAAPAPTYAAPPQPASSVGTLLSGAYVRLTTMFRESASECLAGGSSGTGTTYMDRCQNAPGQIWRVIDQGNGYFHLTTQLRENAGECLEGNQLNGTAWNGASFMTGCQNASGQLWKAVDQGNGYFRLTTMFREGANECLEGREINGGPKKGAAYMESCQNVSSQLWTVYPVQ